MSYEARAAEFGNVLSTAPLANPLLDKCSHDLLRTLRLRNVWEHLCMGLLRIADPSRARARDHGKRVDAYDVPSAAINSAVILSRRTIGFPAASCIPPLLPLCDSLPQCQMPCKRRVEDGLEAHVGSAEVANSS